jgi:hypothetical protein
MKELVTLESPNTLMIKLTGDLAESDVQTIHEKMHQLSEGLDKVYLLVDLSGLKNIPPKAREAIGKVPRERTYDKLAVFGASARVRVLGTLILKLLPVIKKSRFFKTEAEARAWLDESK